MFTKSCKGRSRKGCMICKRKKIKCDEIHPRCQYCEIRGFACKYPQIRKINFKPVVIGPKVQCQTSVLGDCSGRLGDSGLLPDIVGRPIPGHDIADMTRHIAGYRIPGQEMAGHMAGHMAGDMAGHMAGPPPDLLAAKVACNACGGHPDRVTQLETEVKQLQELLLILSGSEDHQQLTIGEYPFGIVNLPGSEEGTDSLVNWRASGSEEGTGFFS